MYRRGASDSCDHMNRRRGLIHVSEGGSDSCDPRCYGFSMGGEDPSVRSEASGGLRDPKGTKRSRYEA